MLGVNEVSSKRFMKTIQVLVVCPFFSPILFRSMIVLVDVLAEGEMANWICLKFFKRSWLVNSFSASPPTSMIYQLQMLFTISLLAPIQKKEKLTDSLYDHCVYFVRAEFEFVSGQTVCETQRECGHLLLGQPLYQAVRLAADTSHQLLYARVGQHADVQLLL